MRNSFVVLAAVALVGDVLGSNLKGIPPSQCNPGYLYKGQLSPAANKCFESCPDNGKGGNTGCKYTMLNAGRGYGDADVLAVCGKSNPGSSGFCQDGISQLFCCNGGGMQTPSGDNAGGNDPLIWGLHGQNFKFDGDGEGWYAYLSEPHFQVNTKFTEFKPCKGSAFGDVESTYFTAMSFSFLAEDGIQADQEILIEVIDPTKYRPGCPDLPNGEKSDGRNCLGDGSIQITIDGEKTTKPGEYALKNDGKLYAFNSHIYCSPAVVKSKSRILFNKDESIHDILPKYTTMSNKCDEWFAERKAKDDLYDLPTTSADDYGWSTFYITTPTYSLRIASRQELVGDCNKHFLDVWITEYPDNDEVWSGIMGETKQQRTDAFGNVFMGRDALISPNDHDYKVIGPYGRHFTARIH